jgi:hypothetical protein
MTAGTQTAPAAGARGGRMEEGAWEPGWMAPRQAAEAEPCVTAWPWAWCRELPRPAPRLRS